MKAFKLFIFILFWGAVFSCSKTNVGSPTISASVNGSSTINFSASYFNQIGIQGSGNGYTINIYVRLNGAGTYVLSDPSTGNFATVVSNGITYTTGGTSTGQITFSPINNTSYYNGSFYFAALNNGQSIIVSNGQFTNM